MGYVIFYPSLILILQVIRNVLMSFIWTYHLQVNGTQFTSRGSSKDHQALQISFEETVVKEGIRLQLKLNTPEEVRIDRCYLEARWQPGSQDWVLANGFQSWTDSHWHRPTAEIPMLRRIARPLMGFYGDYHIPWIERGRGKIHSWSWTEWRREGEAPILLASLNEHTAFTCFQWLAANQRVKIEVDCRGHHSSGAITLIDVLVLEGDLVAAYDQWVDKLALPPLRASPASGWTSWYQHYTNISAEIIADNLRQMVNQSAEHTFFQIDDGYQQAIGDWLNIKDTFPAGMQAVAEDIRTQGMQPGLWLAPTVADKRSDLVKQHPDWLQRTANGKLLRAGYNPLWGGWYYALDTTHAGWQAYMQKVLQKVTQEWGFVLLKLDFLFTACLYPQPNRTRAQLMRDCLQRLRNWAGDAYLLGCGTPLASGFGLFDYCRVGADIHLSWEHKLLKWFRHRERVSTAVALRTVLARAPLAGRVWRNDPDVYLLQDGQTKLSREERALIHRINGLTGELLFTSDSVGTYSDWQQAEFAQQGYWSSQQTQTVTPLPNERYLLNTTTNTYVIDLHQRKIIEKPLPNSH